MQTGISEPLSIKPTTLLRLIRQFQSSFVIALLLASAVSAQTFDVGLGGTDPASGTVLGVSGQITIDFSSPTGTAVQSSNLLFSVDGQTTQLTSNPFVSSNIAANLAWETDGLGNLFVTRLGSTSSQISFTGSNGVFFRNFDLGSGSTPHRLAYFNNFTSQSASVILEGASGPDGPNGFLVGTSTIPEPASALILSMLGLASLLVRVRA